jgi:hypothetical protein
MKLSSIIQETIRLAHAINWHTPLPPGVKRHGGFVCLADVPPPPPRPERDRLVEFLLRQPAAVVYAIAVIMYLGRGDWAEDFDFDECYEKISANTKTLPICVKHIVNKMPFAVYLERGLKRLAEMGVDVDRLLEE